MGSCLFCGIAEKTRTAAIVYEDDVVIAFDDINPQAPVHTILIPKKHIPSLLEMTLDDVPLIGHVVMAANIVARDKGIAERGFRLLTNCNWESGQVIRHLHFHLLGGRRMHWPPG
ncbi:MAG TPA: histidine triad nucleotide-binding protein [Dissulfurispiraceae bacterium]|nr:histidine triad nucleotide-binding protein [Dissulfurispiraceae bacterium]